METKEVQTNKMQSIYPVKTKLPPVLVDVPVNTKFDPTC